MKRLLIAALLFTTPAMANYKPEGWRLKAQEEVRSLYVGLVHFATWSQKSSFWVTATDKGFSMDPFAQNVICTALKKTGQPDSEPVIVSVWDSEEFLKGNLDKIGSATC
ncbi:MAG: hypothetical protein ABJ034_16155 [Hyphomicrobiales bacterium]